LMIFSFRNKEKDISNLTVKQTLPCRSAKSVIISIQRK
jgi:hypothetical protein